MYTNYKTGQPCSRTEYIQNGLDRGELLNKYGCGCVIIQDRTADAYIVYCPKHNAAPEMYKALKYMREALLNLIRQLPTDERLADYQLDIAESADLMAQQALAKVEVK